MNDDKVEGKVKEIGGKAQEHIGRITGDRDQEAKGEANQVEGKVQKKVGDVKEALHEIVKKP